MLRHSLTLSQVPFVAVVHYHIWPKVMLRSLRQHFINPLILVNHLSEDGLPPDYLDDQTVVLNNPRGCNYGGHGGGIDVAVDFLRTKCEHWFIHIEPDCLISSKLWAEDLFQAAQDGAIMAGPTRLPFGPIHPCPSIWDLERVAGTFSITPRTEHVDRAVFDYCKMIRWLIDTNMDHGSCWLWCHLWDCGIKNWYQAAKNGLAAQTRNDGFRHYFAGRLRPPQSLPPPDLAEISQFL